MVKVNPVFWGCVYTVFGCMMVITCWICVLCVWAVKESCINQLVGIMALWLDQFPSNIMYCATKQWKTHRSLLGFNLSAIKYTACRYLQWSFPINSLDITWRVIFFKIEVNYVFVETNTHLNEPYFHEFVFYLFLYKSLMLLFYCRKLRTLIKLLKIYISDKPKFSQNSKFF